MGIEAIITVVPRSEFRKRPRKRDLPTFELNAWGDLDGALEEMGKPVSWPCGAISPNTSTGALSS
jgi:hypothetical protein